VTPRQQDVRHLTYTGALLVAWAAASLLFLALLATELLGQRGTVVLDDYVSAAAPALAALACLRTARRVTGRLRRMWALCGASLLSWAAGGVVWTLYEVHLGHEIPYPSLADVGYLASVPLAVLALLSFPSDRFSGAARLRPLLDGVIAAGSLLFVSWVTVLGPAFHDGTGSLLSQSISLAYPASDVLSATIALMTLARARGGHRTTMSLIGAGLLMIAVADSAFAWFTARGAYAVGGLFDTGWTAGFLLIGLAALRAARQPATTEEGTAEGVVAAPSRLALGLPYAPLLVSMPFAVVMQLRGEPIGPFLFCVGLTVIVAVLARQLLSMHANLTLSRQLQETVVELEQREVQLHHQAFHDPLTGLANRALFADRIEHALTRTRRPDPVILLLADLDDFKLVNDTLGHPAGDALLVAVSERLRAVVRPEDTVARLGGDEFAVLLEAADGLAAADQVAARIAQALVRPFFLSGVETVVGVSIGIAAGGETTNGERATGATMLRDADIAMYAAKAAGKGRHEIFAIDLAMANIDRLQLKADLSEALGRGEMSLKYQPIIDVPTGRLRSVEALLRWTHPFQGEIAPTDFIPLAEASGAIVPIGRWVLEQALAQAGRWQQQRPEGVAPVELSVNLSARQLGDPLLVPTIKAALGTAGLAPSLLTLEITESALMDDDEATMGRLAALRALGLKLAIDDFGTGHSSLSRLSSYPIDTLKIDRAFVAAITPGVPVPDVVITAILALGEGLGMHVVAEGVETDDQFAALRALGCPQAQGYLFARPASPEVITELIRTDIPLADPVAVPG
jgi:diguanylate cyclase (GGDEF)-like protein